MSSENERAKSPLVAFVELLAEMEKNVPNEQKFPTSPEGFESLIPDDLVKKMQEIEKLVDETKMEMVKFSTTLLTNRGKNPYAHLQAIMFLEAHKDLMSASYRLAGIHEFDKPMVDELAKEDNISPEQFIHNTIHEMAMASMLNR